MGVAKRSIQAFSSCCPTARAFARCEAEVPRSWDPFGKGSLNFTRMRLFVILAACVLVCAAQKAPAPAKQNVKLPPETMVFANTYGDVTFTHKRHFDRVGGNC